METISDYFLQCALYVVGPIGALSSSPNSRTFSDYGKQIMAKSLRGPSCSTRWTDYPRYECSLLRSQRSLLRWIVLRVLCLENLIILSSIWWRRAILNNLWCRIYNLKWHTVKRDEVVKAVVIICSALQKEQCWTCQVQYKLTRVDYLKLCEN